MAVTKHNTRCSPTSSHISKPILQDIHFLSFLEISLITPSTLISSAPASILGCSCYSLKLLTYCWVSLSASVHYSTSSMFCLPRLENFVFSGDKDSAISSFSHFHCSPSSSLFAHPGVARVPLNTQELSQIQRIWQLWFLMTGVERSDQKQGG